MRIISGRYRGLKLAEFAGEDIRPTADRVKESLFNIISSSVAGAEVLDLFCGSGNLGIECLSRGAANVTFNDKSKDSILVLRKNLARLKEGNFEVYNFDFRMCLSKNKKYDIIFIDPPYKSETGREALEIIAKNRILNDGGMVIYERDKKFEGEISGLKLFDERKYGRTFLTFFSA